MKREGPERYLEAKKLIEAGVNVEGACDEIGLQVKQYYALKKRYDPSTLHSLRRLVAHLRRQNMALKRQLK